MVRLDQGGRAAAEVAEKNGIWMRDANPRLKPLLDRHWQPYLRGAGTFEEAAAKLVDGR